MVSSLHRSSASWRSSVTDGCHGSAAGAVAPRNIARSRRASNELSQWGRATRAVRPAPAYGRSKAARTSSGMGADFRRLGSAGSRTVHSRVSKPSSASVLALRHLVLHEEAGAAELRDLRLDLQVLAVLRRNLEDSPRLQQGQAGAVVFLQHPDLRHARRLLEQQDRGGVEPLEIARIEDDAGGVAVAPLHADQPGVGQHAGSPAPRRGVPGRRRGLSRRQPSRRCRPSGRGRGGTGRRRPPSPRP